jgi:hypothetical protein
VSDHGPYSDSANHSFISLKGSANTSKGQFGFMHCTFRNDHVKHACCVISGSLLLPDACAQNLASSAG